MTIDQPNRLQGPWIMRLLGEMASTISRLTNDDESDKRCAALQLLAGQDTDVLTADEAREAIRLVCQFGLDEIRLYREKTGQT